MRRAKDIRAVTVPVGAGTLVLKSPEAIPQGVRNAATSNLRVLHPDDLYRSTRTGNKGGS
jgi:hypothetical protein